MDLRLDGHVAIVTGAGRGLGRASALALLEEGALILAAARSEDELDQLRLEAPERVEVVTCDLMDLDAVAALAPRAHAAFGRLDIVVNNAGIAPAEAFVDMKLEVWERVFRINVLAAATLARAAGATFLEQGHGKVINIASTSGIRGKPMLVAYSSSKGAVLRMTDALAAEWASAGVQVNAIAPGAFATQAQAAVLDDPDLLRRRIQRIPARRIADPSEFGALVSYLASDRSDFVTGSTFVIDGGEVNRL